MNETWPPSNGLARGVTHIAYALYVHVPERARKDGVLNRMVDVELVSVEASKIDIDSGKSIMLRGFEAFAKFGAKARENKEKDQFFSCLSTGCLCDDISLGGGQLAGQKCQVNMQIDKDEPTLCHVSMMVMPFCGKKECLGKIAETPVVKGALQQCHRCLKTEKKMPQCQACHARFYCSRECQKEAWATHKQECKTLRGEKEKK